MGEIRGSYAEGSRTEDWERSYAVREVWFEPEQSGFLSGKAAHVYVLGFPEKKKGTAVAVPLEIPFEFVEVVNGDSVKDPTLVLYGTDHWQWSSSCMMGSSYESIRRAVFTLPPEMKLLTPRK